MKKPVNSPPESESEAESEAKRGKGRPPGAKNKPKPIDPEVHKAVDERMGAYEQSIDELIQERVAESLREYNLNMSPQDVRTGFRSIMSGPFGAYLCGILTMLLLQNTIKDIGQVSGPILGMINSLVKKNAVPMLNFSQFGQSSSAVATASSTTRGEDLSSDSPASPVRSITEPEL